MATKNRVIGETDRILLLESRYGVDAVADASRVTADPVGGAAVEQTAGFVWVERTALLAALGLVYREGVETTAARVEVTAALAYATGQLGLLRRRVEAALVPDPDAPPAPDVAEAMQRAFDQVYTYTADGIRGLGPSGLLPVLEAVIPRLTKEADKARVTAARDRLRAATSAVERERTEDRDAFEALDDCRDRLARTMRAHTLTIEGQLVLQGREDELGRFVLSEDPAYKARRAARRPADEEPGIGDVDQEVEQAEPGNASTVAPA